MQIAGILKVFVSLLFLVPIVLGGIAWYTVWQYKIPFSVAIPILTTLLSSTDFFVTYRSILGINASRRKSNSPLKPIPLLLNLLLLINWAVTIVLGAENLGGSQCQLKETWQKWYSAHDSKAIKSVQDALQCCGFGTAKEMPFPFPFKPPKGDNRPAVPSETCMISLNGHNTSPCAPLWQGQLKTAAGLVLGASALMLVVKLVFLMIVLGNPKIAEKWLLRPAYGEHNNNRVVEEIENGEVDEQEAPRSYATIGEGPVDENDANEATRLLPKAYSGNSHQITMHNAWSSETNDGRY